jgi:hypothetical protein
MEKKIYAGSGKKKSDTWLSISINMDKIKDHIQEYNGTKFVKLNVNIAKQADKYGKDVQVSIDTYNPEGRQGYQSPRKDAVIKTNTQPSGGNSTSTKWQHEDENMELPF